MSRKKYFEKKEQEVANTYLSANGVDEYHNFSTGYATSISVVGVLLLGSVYAIYSLGKGDKKPAKVV